VQPADIPTEPLADCLARLRATFNIDHIAAQKITQPEVAEYYRQSDAGYRLFHSSDGALHLALNRNGQFDPAGYYAQAEFVERHMQECAAHSVLEAGSGNGFNTLHLARRHPHARFVGVDLTEDHVAASRTASAGLSNLEYLPGNYESLSFTDGTFDLAFGIETFCQTANLRQALSEMHRVVRPGGRLVVVDCFRQRPLAELNADLQLATKLVEKTTAVDGFSVIEQWIELARSLGFAPLKIIDDSAHTAHNLARFYRLAKGFFDDPQLVQTVRESVPPLLLQNAICGLLMRYTVGGGAHGYYSIALERT
jgi:SAM-dependent methyltransferase